MILLRASYRYGVFHELYFNCNLVRLRVYMENLCHEKMLILRCILPQKTEPPPEKKLTSHPLKNHKHPDKKLTHWE